MEPKTLKELLLEPWKEKSPALFPSQREIARAIAGRPGSRYAGRERSLATFLSQILNQERSCPIDLRDDLIAVAVQAADVQRRSGGWADHSETEIETVLRSKLGSDENASSHLVTDLLIRQLRAREVVIINPSTLEGRGHPRAPEFRRLMLDAVVDGGGARYVFLLDENDLDEKRRHEEQIVLGLQAERGLSSIDARAKFTELTSGENPAVRIESVARHLCIIPIVAFDPGLSLYGSDLFVWDWTMNDDGTVTDNVAKLSPQIKKKWLRDFYSPYVRKDVPSR